MITHQHAEAFKLLTFECDRCGIRERIWNSRDGLILYTVDCEHCFGGWARRALEENDLYLPEYSPTLGNRKFADLTMDRAIVVAGERMAVAIINEVPGRPTGLQEMLERTEALALELYGDGRQPDLITVGV